MAISRKSARRATHLSRFIARSHPDPDRCDVLRLRSPQSHVVRGGAQVHLGGRWARRLGRSGNRLQRSGSSAFPPAHHCCRSLAYSIAGSPNHMLTSGLNDLTWAGVVLSSFPRAMLIMAAAFGLWRAKLISNTLFAAGVAAVVLVLMGGTTWLSGGFWAPDGVYSRLVSPAIGVVWGLVVSGVLLTRPATRAGW